MNVFNIPPSLLEAVNKVLLNEHEMTRGEVQAISQKYASEIAAHIEAANKISGHLFSPGSDRLVIPLQNEEHPTKTAVEAHLHQNGFHSTNYRMGITTDVYGRGVSIGKALTKTKAPKQLINDFAAHQKTYAKQPDTSNLQVVISKHPHDVIGMSQGTQWGLRPGEEHSTIDKHVQSCMKFGTIQHDQYMRHELKAGTHIAWLTKKGDNEAKEPLGRITLRPYDAAYDASNQSMHDSYSFNIPYRSELHKNARESWSDEGDDAQSLESHIFYAADTDEWINDADSVSHVTVSRHPELSNFVATVKFKSPMSHIRMKEFHEQLMDSIGHSAIPIFNTESAVSAPSQSKVDAHTVLIPGKKSYGQQSDGFENTVKMWAEKHFAPKLNVAYDSRKHTYLDGDAPTFVKSVK